MTRMRDWSLRRKLILVPSLSVVLLLVLAAVSTLATLHQEGRMREALAAASRGRSDLELSRSLVELHARAVQCLGWTTSSFPAARIDSLRGSVYRGFDSAKAGLERRRSDAGSPEEASAVDTLKVQVVAYVDFARQMLEMADADVSLANTMVEPANRKLALAIDRERALEALVHEAERSSDRSARSWSSWLFRITALLGVGSIGLVVAFSLWMMRGILDPLAEISRGVSAIAEGDLGRETAVEQKDEIGRMATALRGTQSSLRGAIGRTVACSKTIEGSSSRLHEVARRVGESNTGVSRRMQELGQAVRLVSEGSTHIAGAAARASGDVVQAADSIRGFGQVLSGISASCAAQLEQVSGLHARAETAMAALVDLEQAARRSEEALALVRDIQDHTKMLALNATIEASRAGEAGKGFSVVAQEVKNLSIQTGEATGRIANQLQAMVAQGGRVAESIGAMREAMGQVHELSAGISSSVASSGVEIEQVSRRLEEASREAEAIARGAEQSALGISAASGRVDEVGRETESAAATSQEMEELSRLLSRSSVDLTESVSGYRI
jgi:methyl-accepting chemotaxis protein